MDETLLVDVLITWMGAIGVLRYVLHIRRSAAPSFLEGRTQLLLCCLGAMLLIRGFAWLDPGRWLDLLTFVPATLLPLAAVFFTEALLRRHMPLPMKWYVAIGTPAFFFANVLGFRGWHVALLAFMATTFALLAVLLSVRRREELSPPENRLIDAVLLAVLAAVPLTITDFRMDLGLPFNRMGALAALIFVYTLVRMTTRRDGAPIALHEIAGLGARAAFLAGVMLLVRGDLETSRVVAALSLSLAIVLLFAIFDGSRHLQAELRGQSFLTWLAGAKTATAEEFLESLKECPAAEEHVTLTSANLEGYDVAALVRRLDDRSGVIRITALRARVEQGTDAEIEVDEQLVALLDTYGMSHICLVRVAPPVFLLVNYPQLADAGARELEMTLIRKLGRLAGPQEASAV